MKRVGWGLSEMAAALFISSPLPRRERVAIVSPRSSPSPQPSPARGAGGPRAFLLLSLLATLLLALAAPAHAADPILRLDKAEFILSDSLEPPADSADWKPQTLPDNWQVTRPGTFGYAWYRLRFNLSSDPAEPYGLYIPWLRTVGAIYVNGIETARNGVFEKPTLRAGPESFSIPERRLQAGANTLLIRLWVNKDWRGAVTTVSLGPQAAIQARTYRDRFFEENGAQMACAFAFVLGVYVLLLWARRPKEAMYGYFGLAAAVKAVVISGNFVTNPPFPLPYWNGIQLSASFLVAALLFLYCLRFAGWRWPRVERGLWAWAAAWIAIAWVLAFFDIDWLGNIWDYAHLATYGSSLVLLIYIACRLRTLESILLVFAHSFSIVTMSYDIYADKKGMIDAFNFSPYHLIPLFLVIGWILIDRFAKSLNHTERLNAELGQRVAEKHAELEQNYQRLRELEQQRAVVAERRAARELDREPVICSEKGDRPSPWLPVWRTSTGRPGWK